jgi:hypothetical protein
VTVPENVDAIHSLTLDDRRVSAKRIGETLAISQDGVSCVLEETLDMRKL